jgi:hypothetical protein
MDMNMDAHSMWGQHRPLFRHCERKATAWHMIGNTTLMIAWCHHVANQPGNSHSDDGELQVRLANIAVSSYLAVVSGVAVATC